MKKLLIFTFIITGLLSGCSNQTPIEPEPTPTISPSITKPQGVFYETTPPMLDGLVTELTDDTITVTIEDVPYELKLSKRAKEEIKIYKNKYDTPVSVGSFMQIKYEETKEGMIANNLAFVKVN
ncbi:MAG: hypothetical protein IKB60_00825 [Clostridia bacterium]|nr:hypothetical protein [Clostridia bacterium]